MSSSDRQGSRRVRERDLIARITTYRAAYRERRRAEIEAERERRHERGERFLGGDWVPAGVFERISRRLARRELLVFLEVQALAAVVVGFSLVIWRVFGFLFLPHVDRILP